MADELIDPDYLPFTVEAIRQHFIVDAVHQVDYFVQSAKRFRDFVNKYPERAGIPIADSRLDCQIEKDEKFWTATTMKHLIDSPQRVDALCTLLADTFGERPPLADLPDWRTCVTGPLRLVLEAAVPSPSSYVAWLRTNLANQHFVPYVLHAAQRANLRTHEGPTHIDAIIINTDNGFSLMVEAKVLSDLSPVVSFDVFRNQLARNLDVMLEPPKAVPNPLHARQAHRSLFALLTPACFRARPQSRLYGWLYDEYRGKSGAQAFARDLPHRTAKEMDGLSARIGWLTFEQINAAVPGACPWLRPAVAS